MLACAGLCAQCKTMASSLVYCHPVPHQLSVPRVPEHLCRARYSQEPSGQLEGKNLQGVSVREGARKSPKAPSCDFLLCKCRFCVHPYCTCYNGCVNESEAELEKWERGWGRRQRPQPHALRLKHEAWTQALEWSGVPGHSPALVRSPLLPPPSHNAKHAP